MDNVIYDKYRAVIGLEVHAQLLTQSKIFNADPNGYGGAPNSQAGTITLAHPGTLPKLNKAVITQVIKMGLACHCDISLYQIFDRKNYFYPDLPKGYQITQDKTPICKNGYILIDTLNVAEHKIHLNRIHLEEDAGKLIHREGASHSLVDFNRAGVPLIEIVTEPVLENAEEAGALLTEIRKLVRYLDICDGNMEEGALRCDANISVSLRGATELGKKVEVKNMNSIRNVQRAIDYEIERQIVELEQGNTPISETRTFNAATGSTSSMRTKEELNDYRYFPDPDLSPLQITPEWLDEIKKLMPALPRELHHKFVSAYQLSKSDALVLTESKELAAYFEQVGVRIKNYKAAANWVMGSVKSYLNETGKGISEFPVPAERLAALIQLVEDGVVSHTVAAQSLFPVLLKDQDTPPLRIAHELNLIQMGDEEHILSLVEAVLQELPGKVKEYKNGKKGIIALFMGEVMKKSKGKADPKKASLLLQKKLMEI